MVSKESSIKYNTNHTFAVCAYKESPYLKDCVESLVNQTVKTNIIICTSTPSEYIYNIANKYNITVYERHASSDIQDDWNFAYNTAKTDLVTVAHQDDVYDSKYVEELILKMNQYPDSLIGITDYLPIKNGEIGSHDINSSIKRKLRALLKLQKLADKKFVKKRVLSLGNCICCPSVTYNKKILGETIFTSKFKFCLDWDTFYKIAKMDGRFLYVDKPLTNYRVHDGATSKEFIVDKRREKEDLEMFEKFWPTAIAKFIMIFYKSAYKTYS